MGFEIKGYTPKVPGIVYLGEPYKSNGNGIDSAEVVLTTRFSHDHRRFEEYVGGLTRKVAGLRNGVKSIVPLTDLEKRLVTAPSEVMDWLNQEDAMDGLKKEFLRRCGFEQGTDVEALLFDFGNLPLQTIEELITINPEKMIGTFTSVFHDEGVRDCGYGISRRISLKVREGSLIEKADMEKLLHYKTLSASCLSIELEDGEDYFLAQQFIEGLYDAGWKGYRGIFDATSFFMEEIVDGLLKMREEGLFIQQDKQ